MLGACGDDKSSDTFVPPESADTTMAAAAGETALAMPAATTVDTAASAVIALNISNPHAADEFYVDGIDIEQEAEAGHMSTINFTIDGPGTYEVESHITDAVLVIIEAT